MQAALRQMTEDDGLALLAIQEDAYLPALHETWEVLSEKLRLYPVGCWVCVVNGQVVGYLISHPSEYSSPPAINRGMGKLPESPDCYYIHDLAIRKAARRQRLGQLLGRRAIELARVAGYPQLALIAVQNSQPFWTTLGFAPAEVSPAIESKVRTYCEDATYMRRGTAGATGEQC